MSEYQRAGPTKPSPSSSCKVIRKIARKCETSECEEKEKTKKRRKKTGQVEDCQRHTGRDTRRNRNGTSPKATSAWRDFVAKMARASHKQTRTAGAGSALRLKACKLRRRRARRDVPRASAERQSTPRRPRR